MEEIIRLFPQAIKGDLVETINNRWNKLEEIRLRLNRPIELCFQNRFEWISNLIFTKQMSVYFLNQLSDHSLYRMDDELREGYITIEGGHRVGIAGNTITENGQVKRLNTITFFNIRIAKQIMNVARQVIPYLYEQNQYLNTIIIGLPQSGKTTMIRDLARLIGNGSKRLLSHKVAIIDERSEIAASKDGIPQHEVGMRTDVMDACPKVEGMMMMIRSMSPDVLIVDEIGRREDADSLLEAINAGVTIICSAHGANINMLQSQPFLKELTKEHIFKRVIVLKKSNKKQQTIHIYNERKHLIASLENEQ